MNEQIIHEILGERYIAIDECFTFKSHSLANYKKKISLFDCIEQGIKEINTGTWRSNWFVVVTVLVPEKNIIKYQKYEY